MDYNNKRKFAKRKQRERKVKELLKFKRGDGIQEKKAKKEAERLSYKYRERIKPYVKPDSEDK